MQYNLLLSVFSYLFNIVQLPSFKYGSEVCYQYDMIKEMEFDQGDYLEEAEKIKLVNDFNMLEYFGARLHREICHKYHLKNFIDRLKNFKITDCIDEEIFNTAKKAWDLYRTYPNRNLYDNILPNVLFDEEEDRTRPDQYISFIWSESGWLYEQLIEGINCLIQENSMIEEPLHINLFNTPDGSPLDNLDFEKRLFELLANLADTLYTISDEEHNN